MAKTLDPKPPLDLQARLTRLLPNTRLLATPLPLVPQLRLWLLDELVDARRAIRVTIAGAASLLAVGVERVYPAHGLPIIGRQRVELVLGDIAEALEQMRPGPQL